MPQLFIITLELNMKFLKVLKQVETIIKGEKYVKGIKRDMKKGKVKNHWEKYRVKKITRS